MSKAAVAHLQSDPVTGNKHHHRTKLGRVLCSLSVACSEAGQAGNSETSQPGRQATLRQALIKSLLTEVCPCAVRNGSSGRNDDVGHNVDLPAEVLLDSNVVLSDHYAEVTGEPCCALAYTCARTLAQQLCISRYCLSASG